MNIQLGCEMCVHVMPCVPRSSIMQTLFIHTAIWENSGAFMNFCIEKFKIQHIKQANYIVELLFLFFMESKDMH